MVSNLVISFILEILNNYVSYARSNALVFLYLSLTLNGAGAGKTCTRTQSFMSTQRFFTTLINLATSWFPGGFAARLLGRPLLLGRGGGGGNRGVLQEGLLAVPRQGRPEVPELSDDSVGEL